RAPGGFTGDEIALLKTFADQAVIAIENVRLFKELQQKNLALTEALEQQTATSEILQTIAQAQTDVQPVFDTIVRSAAQLCNAHRAAVFLTDGQVIYHPANYGDAPEVLAAIKARFPRPLNRETAAGTAGFRAAGSHRAEGDGTWRRGRRVRERPGDGARSRVAAAQQLPAARD